MFIIQKKKKKREAGTNFQSEKKKILFATFI